MTTTAAPLLQVRNLRKHYISPKRWLRPAKPAIQAVDGVSFSVARGETLSLVGESGCGKTTTAKSVMRLVEPTSGSVSLDGEELLTLSPNEMRLRRRQLQIIFQDPYASLNPRLTAGDIVAEPLRNFGMGAAAERRERVQWLFSRVGLRPEAAKKFPHEFSGGQRQRLGIARALALNPPHQPPRGRDVPRAHRGDRGPRHALLRAAASVHRDPAVGRSRAEPAHARAPHAAAGRSAEPREPAFGLPLPHALSDGAGHVQGEGAGADRTPFVFQRWHQHAPGRLPLPLKKEPHR
jgi:ABC-type polar amino acid transport system ATPase subunit